VAITYGYDDASELTGLTYTLGTSTLGNLTYSYDAGGRRISQGGSYAQTELPSSVSSSSYNAGNQLTAWGSASLSYDANGNLTSDGTNTYNWSARDKLSSMNSSAISFQYDPYGRRVAKTVAGITTNYLYDRANVVQELSSGSVIANLLSGHTDEIFTRTDSSSTANFLRDGLGSTLALTNSSGGTLASYAYEPFGNTTVTSGSSTNEFQYAGREDDGTGLYFNRARYYHPTLQRFLGEDPIGIKGGVNLFAYGANNPVSFTDPLGLSPSQCMSEAAIQQAAFKAIIQYSMDIVSDTGVQTEWIQNIAGVPLGYKTFIPPLGGPFNIPKLIPETALEGLTSAIGWYNIISTTYDGMNMWNLIGEGVDTAFGACVAPPNGGSGSGSSGPGG